MVVKCIAGSIQIYMYIDIAVKGKYKAKQTKSHNNQNVTEWNSESEDL